MAPRIADFTKEIDYAAGRATALTAQLLAFSRRQISQPKILDLNEVVTHSMKLLRRVIGESATSVGSSTSQVRANTLRRSSGITSALKCPGLIPLPPT